MRPTTIGDRLDRGEVVDLAIIAIVALAGRVGYWLLKGTMVGKDTDDYTATCEIWTSTPWLFPRPQNMGFTVPFCFTTEVVNLPWSAWIGLQILLSVASCWLVYVIATRQLDRVGGLVAGLSMAVLWDAFQWNVYVLTDAVFVVFVTVAIWAISRRDEERSRRTYLVAWGSLLLVAATRPFGVPIVLGWVAYDLLPRGNRHRFGLIPYPVVGIGLGLLGIAFLASQYPRFLTETNPQLWLDGQLVHGAPQFTYEYEYVTDPSIVEFLRYNLPHLVAIAVLRVLLLFLPVLPRWSLIHNLANMVTLVPMVLASATAVVDLWHRDRRLLRRWAMPLVMIVLVVAVTFVDWDWRYRAPAAPVFALLTGYTAWRLWHAVDGDTWWEYLSARIGAPRK